MKFIYFVTLHELTCSEISCGIDEDSVLIIDSTKFEHSHQMTLTDNSDVQSTFPLLIFSHFSLVIWYIWLTYFLFSSSFI